MKELVVVSGKGGTGKTSISAALAYLAPHKVLVDCDVDAANFHLISNAVIQDTNTFTAGFEPCIDSQMCTHCGRCTDLCKYGAIRSGVITSPLDCEGCGVCADHCPAHAIVMQEKQAGQWFRSETRLGPLIHAELGLAIENSGKLVSKIRQEARRLAEDNHLPLIITDGPPGIGCPTIAALSGASLALIVTEPSLSGIHDFERLIDLSEHFHLPVAVCINKSSLHPENAHQIETWCAGKGIPVIGRLPYSDTFRNAVKSGKTVLETRDNEVKTGMITMWNELARLLELPSQTSETADL